MSLMNISYAMRPVVERSRCLCWELASKLKMETAAVLQYWELIQTAGRSPAQGNAHLGSCLFCRLRNSNQPSWTVCGNSVWCHWTAGSCWATPARARASFRVLYDPLYPVQLLSGHFCHLLLLLLFFASCLPQLPFPRSVFLWCSLKESKQDI